MLRKIITLSAALIFGAASGQAQEMMKGGMIKLAVRIENISSPDGMRGSDGTKWPFAMSTGLCIAHTNNTPVLSSGKKDLTKSYRSIRMLGSRTPDQSCWDPFKPLGRTFPHSCIFPPLPDI